MILDSTKLSVFDDIKKYSYYYRKTDYMFRNPEVFFEEFYVDLSKEIVEFAMVRLTKNDDRKKSLRIWMFILSIILIAIEYVFLLLILFKQGYLCNCFKLPETVITVYMSSVFVETLGIIYLIVKYLFSTKSEEKDIEVLTKIISNFQKYNGDKKIANNEKELFEKFMEFYNSSKNKK